MVPNRGCAKLQHAVNKPKAILTVRGCVVLLHWRRLPWAMVDQASNVEEVHSDDDESDGENSEDDDE
jgi:hypothetical protein